MDTSLSDINAYILTGGQSRRLNMDKSLIMLNGQTLTEIIHKKLSTNFHNVFIVGKENHFPNYNFMKDIEPVQCPLNGIVTALEHNQNDWIFIIACDLPLVKMETINNLYNNIKLNTRVVVPFVNDNLQPLCAFYHKSVLNDFHYAIDKGYYSLMKLLRHIESVKVTIPIEDEEQFLNINNPEDLERAEELLRKI
ncbi:MAG: molybdenum cofactor guanylyltransferase [Candidatus Marinimicrobia bacterium]|nr:molybdenum cofactor guanylyltransferase [Candidatus Neomarinimicrobiota bacterium]